MTRHPARFLAGLSAAGLLLSSCTGGASNGRAFNDAGVPAGGLRLVAFDSCAELVDGLRSAAKEAVGPWGFSHVGGMGDMTSPDSKDARAATGGKDAAPDAAAPPVYSGTNTHEVGVDEPDLVKTDGRRIVTVQGGVLRVVDAGSRTITGAVALAEDDNVDDPGGKSRYGLAQLLLSGDRALVLGQRYDQSRAGGPVDGTGPAGPSLTLVDIAGQPRVIGRYGMEGGLVDARQVGSIARVVVRSAPHIQFPQSNEDTPAAQIAVNREIIGRAPVEQWLPRYSTVDATGQRSTGRVDCTAVSRPAQYSGAAMLTVLTFDLNKALGSGDPISVVADGDTVYANGPSLYVANDQRWRAVPVSWAVLDGQRTVEEPKTQLYKFDISGSGKPRFSAAGEVAGWLLNQYSMSEWDGYLRVATTEGAPWDRSTKSSSTVFVLRQSGGSLVETGRVGGLGKGERIYSVRFIGTLGYVVTFRQTDPLYTVDLRDPKSPKVLGELKITGYSAYLHPASATRLLGIGQEANEQGRIQGTQVSLFDVSNPDDPVRLAQHHVKGAHSEAEFSPHAFLYWPRTGLLVVPFVNYRGGTGSAGALALSVRGDAIVEIGTVSHPAMEGQIRRSLVIDQTLWTLSDAGLKASDIETLASTGWVPFA